MRREGVLVQVLVGVAIPLGVVFGQLAGRWSVAGAEGVGDAGAMFEGTKSICTHRACARARKLPHLCVHILTTQSALSSRMRFSSCAS